MKYNYLGQCVEWSPPRCLPPSFKPSVFLLVKMSGKPDSSEVKFDRSKWRTNTEEKIILSPKETILQRKSVFKYCETILSEEEISTLPECLGFGLVLCCRDFRHLLMSSHSDSLAKRSGVTNILLPTFLNFSLVHKFQLAGVLIISPLMTFVCVGLAPPV